MKRIFPVSAAIVLGLAAKLFAAGPVYDVRARMDRTPSVYEAGETAKVNLRVYADGVPVGGRTAKCSWNYLDRREVVIPEEGMDFELHLDRPGQVMFRADMYDGTNRLMGVRNGKPTTQIVFAGALFSPEKLVPSRPRPADFDEFWAKQIECQRREVPFDPETVEITEVKSGKEGFRVYDVVIPALVNEACGYLVVPEGAAAKSLPAVMMFQGYGSVEAVKEYHPGVLFFCINSIGFRHGPRYREARSEFLKGDGTPYQYRGWNDRESCFFRGQILRGLRALEWIRTRPEWNGRDLAVKGVSMGGNMSLQMAALDPKVTLCVPRDPALCDHAGIIDPRGSHRSGWPWILANPRVLPDVTGYGPVDPVVLAVSDYYDNVNFASRITCRVYLATGFGDDVCFSEGVLRAYNQIRGPKFLETDPYNGHCGTFNRLGEKALEF